MGNRGSVNIHLDRQVFQAGQPCTGTVVMKVRRPLKDGGKVMVHLVGKEKVDLSSRSRRAERSLLRVQFVLRDFTQWSLLPRTYTFPFTIDLPASLPASTKYPANTSSEKGFQIAYNLRAGIFGTIQLETQRPVWIASAPLPDELVPCMIEPTTFDIRAAKLFNRGAVSFGASVTDSHVGRGQTLDVHLACRNESTTDIQRVEIKLIEHLRWTISNSLEQVGPECLEVTETLLWHKDVNVPGLNKNRRSGGEVRKASADPLAQPTRLQEIFEDLLSGHSNVELEVPFKARDSYNGRIVRISHYLEVRLQTGRMQTNPTTKIPIRIGTPSVSTSPRPTTPVDFPSVNGVPMNNNSSAPLSEEDDPAIAFPEQPEIPVAALSQDTADAIPMVAAVAIPDDAVQASMTTASADVIVLGGDAVLVQQPGSSTDLSELVPLPPPTAPESSSSSPATLDRLLREMSISIDDHGYLVERMSEAQWRQLVGRLSPDEFGRIVHQVKSQFDQPRVAVLLSPHVNKKNGFLCIYAAAAVRNTSEWNRATMAQRLLPLCTDVANFNLIHSELNEWDQVITQTDFQEAIDNARIIS